MRKVLFILGQLTDEDVEWLGKVGQRARVPAGTTLIAEGKPIEALYIVLDGRLSVSKRGESITELESGDIVGEMSFVDASPPSATVTAVDDAKVLAVARVDLANQMEEDPGFAARFYRAIAIFLSDRLRSMDAQTHPGMVEATEADELDPNVLDHVSLAGDRFNRLLRGSFVDFHTQL